MESLLKPSEKDNLVSSFLEIAAGQTADTAVQFLQATSWQLEEALQLFYVGSEGGAGPSSAPAYDVGARDRVVADEKLGGELVGDDGVRAPLPVEREVLYDDASLDILHNSSVAFRKFEEETKRLGVWESGQSAASSANSSQDNLASLYRPPFSLMHSGPFDKARFDACFLDKWLLVNLQSTDEFNSHMLNRDTWSNEAVVQTIRTNFIFWQVYHDTREGKKISNYYDLVNIPVILVIDPVSGQKMRAWNGMVQPDRLLEDLLPFMDRGPQGRRLAAHKRRRDSAQSSRRIRTDKTPEDGGEVSQAAAVFTEDDCMDECSDADDEELRCDREVAVPGLDAEPVYPSLPEEPTGSREILCKVGIRLPDGRRIQRNFLRTDPIQLLWSFCSSEMGEGVKRPRPFRFTQAIPGMSKSIEYGSKLTFAESGLSNSMISLAWE